MPRGACPGVPPNKKPAERKFRGLFAIQAAGLPQAQKR